MKKITFSIIALVLILVTAVSCTNQSGNEKADDNTTTVPDKEVSVPNETNAAKDFSIAPIVANYLKLENALAADDGQGASGAGKQLAATLQNMDMNAIPADKMKQYMEIAADTRENAEHIRDNAGKIAHQREHLEFLSKDVLDLIALLGAPQKLYQIHCPMFNNGKGADWISDSKEINNPYYGSQMPACGEIVKELK
ncbi:MAG: DUF3347 domain-containing protein [Chitinophagaceae bacterium]|nr:DUF3347 domain-containing protein [Chitinophagaceae bacterium]